MNRNKLNSKKRKEQQCNDGEIRLLQEVLYTPDHILKKIFRKDGPPLGDQFDSLPSHAFHFSKRRARENSKNSHRACPENQKAFKTRKVYESTIHYQISNQKSAPLMKHGKGKGLMAVLQLTNPDAGAPVRKHGKGKGLMAVLQVTNPGAGDFPMDIDFGEGAICPIPVSISKKPTVKVKRKRVQRKQPVMQKIGKKLQEKRKLSVRRKKVDRQKNGKPKQPRKEKCELALKGGCQEHLNQFAMLVDDEELELRELQAGPNPLTCSAHFATNGMHGCSFCKDLLAKFPPNSVAMKKPLYMQPWDSSPEVVKKLFKVFHFLYSYAAQINMHSFTLDEFAQAFHDKDSLLLGRINMALLKLLLSDVEMELSSGFISHLIKNCNFLGLLHLVKCQDFILNFWKKSLNPMTWPEILRQLLVAAGFGLKHGTSPKEALGKEVNLMSKYGLRPGTLKGELFNILSLQGNNGSKVSELAKSMPIVELNLAATTDELELLISSMLSSDITLFEKISSSAYRLRISSITKECENDQSDSEDFGSVDDDSKVGSRYSSSDDSEFDSGISCSTKSKQRDRHDSQTNNILVIDTEIDESHPGQVWLLGLTEGEYSELSIEEKLNALVALIDLLSAGLSIRMEDPVTSIAHCAPNINQISSGGKIKRSTAAQHNFPRPFEGYIGQAFSTSEANTRSSPQPVDSSTSLSKVYGKEKSSTNRKDANNIEVEDDLHPMQSIYLGSDRRYNRYWLFLGPCNDYDPGHKRIYFESSEDGQWEVIDTEEALCTLLSALDHRGSRETHLISSLKKRVASLCSAMSIIPDHAGSRQPAQSDHSELNTSREDSSSAVSDVDNNLCQSEIGNDFPISTGAIVLETEKKREQQKQKWSRLQAFDLWIWNSFYSNLNAVKHGKKSFLDSLARCEHCHDLYWRDEKHCKICHTTFELDFDLEERYAIHAATCRKSGDTDVFPKHKILSSQLQSLKAATYAIESVMPEDALVGAWTKSAHCLWIKRLRRTSTLVEFLQVLADFVSSINEDWLLQCNAALGFNSVMEEIIAGFPTMLQTSSAVAIWLFKLDSLIAPYLERIHVEKGKHASSR